ncbi:type I glyceraldehyde-3-phosphate dehydrogenase [Sphingobium sp. TA15]|uniref:Glyceraldehyde-3-phosphate dehydrogenase n=3 Tax=Sphingobium indicum TaxID=332055 RepID=D4Z0L2_SPHIU|nr:type I glyceraldehyde-3-phosphate dehydrogenase [Sphingobium indicum]KEZ00278.1 glyceraldehyde-3-phosphate dehydrogenase [Sphingomonas sp. BHC-A]BDD65447.1 type I glyceraldehyde-3-phosphate dehydrogenase [Sphingobium sp. TA15]APL94405.1 glyceraldehyde-3-phosphate dehydrogenase [Sphingobium indicum B90A]NYI24488.1 glyceraldehyde 3-phosphate dehydrogenase [Sphingobium indicum]RYM04144.1 type I glyceraldehyde-3-phosphate dehydrogenase [Sphingobium indicum]
MATKVAINGFGRIGRLVARAILSRTDHDLELVSINDLGDAKSNALLFKRDSVHGNWGGEVSVDGDALIINGKRIAVTAERDPSKLPHAAQGVEIALECTGIFADKAKASAHLTAGAKRVIISAPATGVDKTVVFGVNHETLSADDVVISNASCTTNCLAPLAKVLHDALGIEKGFMTTIHSYTNDQNTLDQLHKDMRRARAAAVSMIPTTTGAARAVGEVMPELKGKLDGSSVRVPTPNVSVVDLKFIAKRSTSVQEVNELLKAASEAGPLKGILGYSDEPLVSIDYNGDARSSTVDSLETAVIDGTLVRVLSWYDNEWGFSNRMIDTSGVVAKFL